MVRCSFRGWKRGLALALTGLGLAGCQSARPLAATSPLDDRLGAIARTEKQALRPPAKSADVPAERSDEAEQPERAEKIRLTKLEEPSPVPPAAGDVIPERPVEPVTGAPLGREELESLALSNNPAVAEAIANVNALRGRCLQVGLYPNPTAGYQGSEIGNEGRAGQQGAFVGQEFVTGGKLGLNRAVAAQEVARAERQLAATQQRVLTDVRTAYYEVLIAQRRLETAGQLVEIGRRAADTVEQLRAGQEASLADLLQARTELNLAQIAAANARATYHATWLRLGAVTGMGEMQDVYLSGSPESGLPAIVYEDALQRLLGESPELAAAQATVERARWAVQRARVEPIPNIDVVGGVQHDNASSYTIANAQIGVALPLWSRNQGGIQQAECELVSATRAVERVELSLQRRLAATWQRYAIAREQVDRYAGEILPQVRQTLELTSQGYKAGEFDFLRLLTAQRTYFQTNLTYLDSLREMWVASQEIEGLLLSNSLENGAGAGSASE